MSTTVHIIVPLELPLSLVNELEAEAVRLHLSIPEMLQSHLIESQRDRQAAEYGQAAFDRLHINGDGPLPITPPGWDPTAAYAAGTGHETSPSPAAPASGTSNSESFRRA